MSLDSNRLQYRYTSHRNNPGHWWMCISMGSSHPGSHCCILHRDRSNPCHLPAHNYPGSICPRSVGRYCCYSSPDRWLPCNGSGNNRRPSNGRKRLRSSRHRHRGCTILRSTHRRFGGTVRHSNRRPFPGYNQKGSIHPRRHCTSHCHSSRYHCRRYSW